MTLIAHLVQLRDGTRAELHQAAGGLWACPVCGSVELQQAPYFDDGAASFEMCSCGFEFGFDDDPGASSRASESVQANWKVWRERYLRRFTHQAGALTRVRAQLAAIGVVDD